MKEVYYLLAKFLKLTVLNLAKKDPKRQSVLFKILRYQINKEILILYRIVKILKVPIPKLLTKITIKLTIYLVKVN